MNALQAALLGLIQGLTEFLPVSSSGHLILGSALLRLPAPGLSFSIMVHLGTAFATLAVLWGEIGSILKGVFLPGSRGARGKALAAIGCLAAASVPGALLGLFGRDLIDRVFSSGGVAAVGLIITGFVLRASGTAASGATRESRAASKRHKSSGGRQDLLSTVTLRRALNVGIAQAIAVIPGISRSGSTITVGLLSGLSREDAARFSFLMSIPATFGAALLEHRKLAAAGAPLFTGQGFLAGGIAFVAGVFAYAAVFRAVRRGELSKFAYYCWAAGTLSLAWLLVKA
jgi:undecaprenyl-diphosphatase